MNQSRCHRVTVAGITTVVLALLASIVQAQQAAPPPPPPLPAESAPPPAPGPAAEPETPVVAATAEGGGPRAVQFGGALRMRWVSVPSWFLGAFTKENVPLSSYHIGGEFFRRKGDLDITLGVAYQRMSPPDGNFLGKSKPPELDTDFVQFRGLGMLGVDVAFIWHQRMNEYFGFHYGAGLGLALVTGKMLRTSAGSPGCKDSPGDESKCFPIVCSAGGCDEKALLNTEGGKDNGPGEPHRFADPDVPGAIPILNVLAGFNVRIPEAKGLEFKFEGGFYNAFFLGGGIGYAY